MGEVWCLSDLCSTFQSTSQSNSQRLHIPKGPCYHYDPMTHIQAGCTRTQKLTHGGKVGSMSDKFMKNFCNFNSFCVPTISYLQCGIICQCKHSRIHYTKFIWQIVFSKGNKVRSKRIEERNLCRREEESQRGTASSVFFGSYSRENLLRVHKENTINYVLWSSFITQDYHPRSIHHIERVVCISHTCSAIWIRLWIRKHTHSSSHVEPKAINPLCDLEVVQEGLCLCVSRCLMVGYEPWSNQSSCTLIWLLLCLL